VEISDWLTKIVVGLGLVNLKNAPELVNKAVHPLKGCLGDCYLAIGIGIILAFPTLGFLFGNIFTRLFLARAISQGDPSHESLMNTEKTQNLDVERIKGAVNAAVAKSESGGAAESQRLISPDQPTSWQEKFEQTAAQYEQDKFNDIRERIRWKDQHSVQMAQILMDAKAGKNTVTQLAVKSQHKDGTIAGLASYCIILPEQGDIDLLLQVSALAGRLHTRYRLILAFRELLQKGLARRPQLVQLRVPLRGWLDTADRNLRDAIAALENLIDQQDRM